MSAQARRKSEARPARPPRLEVVKPRKLSARARRRRARALTALTVFGTVLLVFGVVAVHALLAQGSFELTKLEERVSKAEARYSNLRLEVAELEAPDRIIRVAKERLGMTEPQKVTYLAPKSSVEAPNEDPETGDQTAAAGWANIKRRLGDD